MKFFFATGSNNFDILTVRELGAKRILLSYFDVRRDLELLTLAKGCELFLDSGAFSAFTQKKPITVQEYGSFLLSRDLKLYSTLDVIGDPKKTWENIETLESMGLKPLPVYHITSEQMWLDKLLEKYDTFALGGMVPYARQRTILRAKLDAIWKHIVTKRGKDNLPRVHAFGMAASWLLLRYPFYSSDSTSWFAIRKYGQGQNKAIDDATYKFIRAGNTKTMFMYEVEHFLKLESTATNLWTKRGVTWTNS